jgi:hypothetical protein
MKAYYNMRAQKMYKRKSVKHSRYEFVHGDDYTNTIEGFWGLLKPSMRGTHRWVSKQHLQLYVNEAVWKYNRRGQQLYPQLFGSGGTTCCRSCSKSFFIG